MTKAAGKLTLYIRPGCHLCKDMLAGLQAEKPRLGFAVEVVDIQANPDLEARYGPQIPVLCGEDTEICHYFLDPVALQRYFENH